MKEEPIINILTRTSKRPNYFKKCVESIRNQTYKNINHIISVDNDETEEYVKKYTNNYIRVNNFVGKIPPLDPIYKIRRPAPYNLYLNDLKENINDGWIMFLDDDNFLLENNAIETLVNNIDSDNQMLFWKVKFSDFLTLPEEHLFNEKYTPTLNHVDMNGFMFHSKYKNCYFFDYYSAGDFFCAKTIERFTSKKIFVNKILVGMQSNNAMGGKGKRFDI